MPKTIQSSFARGEISPGLYGRVDLKQYMIALARAKNMIVRQYGGISNRPGTKFIGPVKDHTKSPRLIPFQFKTEDTHIIEFGDGYFRFLRNDGHIIEATVDISTITQANPGVVTTSSAHGYSTGQEVFISSVIGMTEVNGQRFKINVTGATTFELQDQVTGVGVNTTSFNAYVNSGTTQRIYTLAHPYTQAQLKDVKYKQTADVVTLVHPDHPPRELQRLALTNWQLIDIVFAPEVSHPTELATSGGSGAIAGQWTVTTIDAEDHESLPGVEINAGATAITNITQANPAVVTAAGHGLTSGDICRISGVVGMTAVNNRHFFVNVLTANTFELVDENSTAYTAYSSGGSVNAAYTTNANSTNVTISWNAVAGARRYRIFKKSQGVFGFIGSTSALSFLDTGTITPNLSDTPPAPAEPFNGTNNRPSAVGFHQQRMVFGGSRNNPDRSWFSVVADFHNFSHATPYKEDDAFSATLASDQINDIRHYVSAGDLLTFTSSSEWVIKSTDGAFSISTVDQRRATTWGSSQLVPIVVGNTILYITASENNVRGITFAFEIDNYVSDDISLYSQHMFENKKVVDWGYIRYPDPIIMLIMDDGTCAVLTYNRSQEIFGWTTWDTQGNYEHIATIATTLTDLEEQAYFVIQRKINGNTVRYIERTLARAFEDIGHAEFLDSDAQLHNPIDIESISFASNHVTITATAHGLVNGNLIDIHNIEWKETLDAKGNNIALTPLNGGRYLIADATANTVTLQNPSTGAYISSVGYPEYLENGDMWRAVSTITGLFHLKNTPVKVLADGNVLSLTVDANGTITLPRPFSHVHIGLQYVSEIETLHLESPANNGTIQGKKKNINFVTVRFEQSRGLLIGPDRDNLTEFKEREFELMGEPTDLITGDKEVHIAGKWNTTGKLVIRQVNPLPMNILAIIPDLYIGDDE